MNTLKLFGFVAATAVVGASALFTAPQASAQEVKMRLHTFVPPVSRSFKNVTWWAKQVEKKSGGRIKITLFPSRQLGGKPSDLYDQARRGFVDMIYSLPGYSPGRFPRSEVFELPFIGGKSPKIMSPAMMSVYDPWLKGDYKDTHPILIFAAGDMALFSHKPLNKLEDLKGLKVRVSGRLLGRAFKSIGATPVGIPGIKMAEAFQRHVIDAVFTAWTISLPTKIVRMASHFALPGLSNPVLMIVMNKKSYDGLPGDLKKVVDSTSGMKLAKEFGARWEKDDLPGIGVAKKSGKPYRVFTADERKRWASAASSVTAGWVADMKKKGIDGDGLIKAARAAMAKYDK
ncbi:MAG: TRAP transporter substrate-binding protein [Rhodospirillales bacterium]|jgi:TRAP-type C4-dicarboxylate transport system substrate-binding protein|nr:TRAP transporter substrate-binding protein [Rhodospirillales bacterium]MDP6642894.1 TRAP transporter substrate-binding protein [Rhodospirillales bacterium]MDP6842936.1 TRAP transporter substrate-binding protein [Rhodospirillales bacterium]|tara:strand:- start:4716 stop:5747 length:1032 start_codon:yes stop_codon:yes gene_type:complete